MTMKRIILVLVLLQFTASAFGKITLPSLFSNNMVLQQKSSVKIWGWAEPGEQIIISTSWSNRELSACTGADGRWHLEIKTPSHRVGEMVKILSGSSNEEIVISNVLIGEVWLASGQSNMEFEMQPHNIDKWMTGMYDWEKESDNANYPNIHLFKVEEAYDHTTPQENCKGEWIVCTPEAAREYSAIAFLFARELHTLLDMPVGIILCAFGGTHAESWTRKEVMEKNPVYDKVYESYAPDKEVCRKYPHKVPSAIWNAMVNPIVGYTIKGNIWYQAESNAWRAGDYPPIFVNMVNDWRGLWGQKRLPFYFMQVAPFGTMPGVIRESQAMVWEKGMLDDIGMPTAIDVGDSLDIHPKNKVIPAHRFALWAFAKEYRMNVEFCGPLFKSAKVNDGKVKIAFKYDKGLYIKGEKNAGYLYVSDSQGKRHRAFSAIENGKLTVWHPDVKEPAVIEYCTDDYCKGDIYNGAGLPAYPFKVDLTSGERLYNNSSKGN